jgi:hypothetical protein
MASMVTTAPLRLRPAASFSSNRGMAVVSLVVVDRLLSENQTAVGGESGNQMQRGPSLGPVVAAAHSLAVDGDRLERLVPAGADPVGEAGAEQARIDPVRQDIEPAPRGNPQSKGRNRRKNP